MRRIRLCAAMLCCSVTAIQAGEIDFVETFALATEREEALKQLIPGTEEFYYWNSLHLLNTEQFEQVEKLLQPWVQRHGETPRVWEIRTRRALLTYDRQPEASLQYLRNRFGIHYPHRKEELNAEPNLPTTLDNQLVHRDAFRQQALARHGNSLNGFGDTALEWLIAGELNPDQRRQLLSRMRRPDYPQLVPLVVADLNHVNSGGFGSLPIHGQLLTSQLEALLHSKPEVLNHQHFVRAYLLKLQPGPDTNWRHNLDELQTYLDRLQKFADRLSPVHNSLKAHVLYHRLVLGRRQGKYDKNLFLAYLKLPRPMGYLSKAMLESDAFKQHLCDLNTNYDNATLLTPIGHDEPLVRDFLLHFLADAPGIKEFEPYVNDVYLTHLFAEAKIVNGRGEPEQWASQLPPELFRQLKERVDLDFDPTNPTEFAADAKVSLSVNVKNVSTLLVKVFEINTRNFYRQHAKEVDTDINLDGLVANVEQSHKLAETPFRRVKRRFDFPMLEQPGLYVIDFIGNGQSSRALVRKGQLKHLVRTTPAGQKFTILDGSGTQVKDATLWLAGHEYRADDSGEILVPFSTQPGRQPVVLTAPVAEKKGATYSSLGFFQHEPESYQFAAGFYVDREALLARRKAELVIRPGLSVNGTPVSLQRLEDVKLTIVSTDLDGISTSIDVPHFPLFEDRESIHEFQVPARLVSLTFRLSARIRQLITGTKTDVSTQDTVTLNAIDRTDKVEDLHLVRADGKYLVELRGRNGEPKPSRPVSFQFKHRDFHDPIFAVLKTDPNGQLALGVLDEIVTVIAAGPEGTSHTWNLVGDRHTYAQTVHARTGETITVPYLGKAAEISRSDVSLLELRGGTYSVDRFEHCAIQQGLVTIGKLPAGDYELVLKATGAAITIRVTDGKPVGRYLVGEVRQLETKPLKPLQIESITPHDEQIRVQLRNASKFARVHVFATRYVPEYDAFGLLSRVRGVEPYLFRQTPAPSVYLTGRNIGDEYRYIIDRRFASKFPGNMLDRPALLLNPWAVRETDTGEQVAAPGGDFAAEGKKGEADAQRKSAEESRVAADEHFADLDFLAMGSAVLVNLAPDEEGVVQIKKEALAGYQQIHVVAVDPLNTTLRSLTLPEKEPLLADLRLNQGLDPQGHFTRRKLITIVPAGKVFELKDFATSKFEAYDSLEKVFGLYSTLNPSPQLAEFAFLLTWPKLKTEEKREYYSKFASHELSFFLSRKDPEFFRDVIQPYLANKRDKTFLDRYLIEDDLGVYLTPWKYGQLNIVERILLARRIEGERPKTARHVADLMALAPPDVDRFLRLFDTATQLGDLNANGTTDFGFGITDLRSLKSYSEVNGSIAGQPGAAAPAAPPAEQPADRPMSEEKEQLRRQMKQLDDAKAGVKAKDGRVATGRFRGGFGRDKERAEAKRADEDLDENANGAMDRLAEFDAFFEQSGALGGGVRQLYRTPEKTWELAENNYYRLTIDQQVAGLITANAFWKDFAAHDPDQPFLSSNLAEASRNFPEMLLAMAVLDLPFQSPKHETKFDGPQMTLTAGGPMIVFHEEIQPAGAPDGAAKVLVTQNFFRHGDRQRIENGETVDKFVSEEFLIHAVYGCQVVITNPTSSRQKLSVLVQIPRGSIPVLGSQPTRTLHLNLEPYHTQTLEYFFYFPAAGDFVHFPVHVARNETVIAAGSPMLFHVVSQPTIFDKQSWEYVSQQGTLEEVAAFLESHNINQLNLDKIAWRMHDKAAFATIIPLLTARHVYQHTLWSYALLHNEVAAAREFLQHADNIVSEAGGRLASTLLRIDPVARRTYEYLEYKPLVNARAHALGKRRRIVNERFSGQYHRLLKELAYSTALSDEDRLAVTYYLFLQDRIEEALAMCGTIHRDAIAETMQYDYCVAYAKLFSDEPEAARAIAAKYANHPVDRWRKTFATIAAQLDEAAGTAPVAIDSEDRNQQQGQLAATEPSFDFTVESRQIQLAYRNLKSVTVNFYKMDVELLFSRNPFVQQVGGNFASIRPNLSQEIHLNEEDRTLAIDLPESLKNTNVLVEITGGGETKTQPYFSHSLSVQMIENYGQLAVTDAATHAPAKKVYVKVYAQSPSGQVKFYKDGYTDLRGRFDYASLSTSDLDVAAKFAILILSDDRGAMVREVLPPKR